MPVGPQINLVVTPLFPPEASKNITVSRQVTKDPTPIPEVPRHKRRIWWHQHRVTLSTKEPKRHRWVGRIKQRRTRCCIEADEVIMQPPITISGVGVVNRDDSVQGHIALRIIIVIVLAVRAREQRRERL